MKRFLKICCVILLVFFLVGCGCKKKEEEKVDKKISVEEILNTDDKKLVYNNNDLYKIVVYYTGEKITGIEHYYEYADIDAAKEALTKLKEEYKNNIQIKDITRNGKYIVYTINENDYKDKTLSQIKEDYSFLIPVYKD